MPGGLIKYEAIDYDAAFAYQRPLPSIAFNPAISSAKRRMESIALD